jgi:hypothetical protein
MATRVTWREFGVIGRLWRSYQLWVLKRRYLCTVEAAKARGDYWRLARFIKD